MLDFVPGMYASRSKKFNVCDDGTFDGQNLKSDDLRLLIRTEEELSQTKGSVRLLPSNKNSKYLEYFEEPSYSDQFLAAWEKKYCDNREKGREERGDREGRDEGGEERGERGERGGGREEERGERRGGRGERREERGERREDRG